MRYVPFTAHFKVIPFRGKRFEYVRDLQKIAKFVYDGLLSESSIQIATPGGGQQNSYGGTDFGAMGNLAGACAVKPQIGNTPAQLMITGFYHATADNTVIQPATMRFSGGDTYTSSVVASRCEANPISQVDNEVKTLRTLIDAAIAGSHLPHSITCTMFRLDYSGIVYGDRGYHFPI